MIVETIPVGVFQCNCTILGCEATRQALVPTIAIHDQAAPDPLLAALLADPDSLPSSSGRPLAGYERAID